MTTDDRKRGDVLRSLDNRRDIFMKLYFQDGLSLRDAAFRLGVSLWSLEKWCKDKGITLRTGKESQLARSRRVRDSETIIRLRLKDQMTMEEIAQQCGYANKSTVYKILSGAGLSGKLETLPTWEEWQAAIRQPKSARRTKA